MFPERGDDPLTLIVRQLKALADPSRLAILHALREAEKNVTELVEETGLKQANISKHLRILREEGLVSKRRENRNIFYSLTNGVTQQICTLISKSLESKATGDSEILKTYLAANASHVGGREKAV